MISSSKKCWEDRQRKERNEKMRAAIEEEKKRKPINRGAEGRMNLGSDRRARGGG